MDGERAGRNILIPVDFTPASRAAVVTAARQAEGEAAILTLLHVLHEPARQPGFYARGGMRRVGLVPQEQQAARLMTQLLEALRAEHPELPALASARTLVVAGLPVDRILAVAEREGANLIVMGHHPHDRLHRLLWGSVAERVQRRAAVPVALVEPGAA